VTGSCERGNEHLGSLQFGEFLDSLRNFLSSQEGLCFVDVVVTKKCSQILIRIGGPLQTCVHSLFFSFTFVYGHAFQMADKLDQTLTLSASLIDLEYV
jgi:hypothetical protein